MCSLENMVNMFNNKKILVTGHTGFKGSWLASWLHIMGAKVIGYSLYPNTTPNHYDILGLSSIMKSIIGDVRDFNHLYSIINIEKPEIIFHLAAEPIVKEAFNTPRNTFSTNIMGTVNLLDACRLVSSKPKAIVVVTSDKAYMNKEWYWGYRETDKLGGKDPYSASKGCTDIVAASFRDSFYGGKIIATARAGNVIGGGDWSKYRLIPDLIKVKYEGQIVNIRNPDSIRPWQHVLDCLYGYLILAYKLYSGESDKARAWNFGPMYSKPYTVKEIVDIIGVNNKISITEIGNNQESKFLKLDSSDANFELGWDCIYNTEEAISITEEWYKLYYKKGDILTINQIKNYMKNIVIK